ncbi:hypothetical protein MBLNU459_g7316t2 [Dothideomycetes sp. NU459]
MKSLSRRLASRISSVSQVFQSPPSVAASDKGIRRRSSGSQGRALAIDDDIETLSRYSSGRWLWNDDLQQACRRLKFDVAELAKIAASAANSKSCVRVGKLSEGSFNKAFLLTMDDGKEVIAKLPNPNAGYEHFTTASEVATMDYARNVLGIPAPQVYSWSSSTNNTVGAEYIIMEKCRGVELHRVWDDVTDYQKSTIIQKLVGYEAAFTKSKFSMYGSLYYMTDLPDVEEDQRVLVKPKKDLEPIEFAIGPTTDRAFYDHGRRDAIDHRGPWQYEQSTETKRRTLENFESVARYLGPRDPVLSSPVLWHTDLHSHNIFVDEQDPTEITAIIDWQAVHIAPLFAQARHPAFLEFDGEVPKGFDPSTIKLPENYEDLDEDEQKAARRLRGAQLLWKLYEIELVCQCDDVNRAIRFGESLMGRLPSLAGNVYSDGELLVEELLIQLQQEWDEVVEDSALEPCPIAFTEEDKVRHDEQFTLWAHGVELMTDFLNRIGGYRGWDGSVSHQQFNAGREDMELFKEEFIAKHSSTETEREKWIEVWPFK